MNKSLLISALLLGFSGAASAQLTVHSFQSATFTDEYGESYDATGEFHHVSANGQFAVGYDDQMQSASNGCPFLWRRSNPDQIEFLNTDENRITAADVTNDGMIVGSFEERDPDVMDPVECYPGYKTLDGNWTRLPMPDDYDLSYAKSYDFMNTARAVSSDGKYIAGHASIKVGYNSTFGWNIIYTIPLLWEKTDNGYELKAEYLNLGDAGKSYIYKDGAFVQSEDAVNYKLFYMWDLSNDGTTIAGYNMAESGGFNPAIIRNGVLMQLFNCDLDVDEDGSCQNFNGGICNSIDANGNVYGYFQDGEKNMQYFMLGTDDKLIYFDTFVTCATADGTTIDQSTSGVSYVLDCSDDGQVLAGAGVGYTDLGAYSYPVIASNDNTTAIDRAEAIRANVGVSYKHGGKLYVTGVYDEATIYNAAGVQIASGKQGHAFSMSSLPAGTYIVKVATANGTKTFKVAR